MVIPQELSLFSANDDAEEAANFYAQTFPDSKVLEVNRAPSTILQRDVIVVWSTVMGIICMGSNGGPQYHRAQRVLLVHGLTDDQWRPDRYWNAIVGNGGESMRLARTSGDFLADHAASSCRSPWRPDRRLQARVRGEM